MTWRSWAMCAVLAASMACRSDESTTMPQITPTLLITNNTCDSVECGTLEVRVFFESFLQWIPENPLGLRAAAGAGWYVAPGQKCFAFDPYTITITGPDSTGAVHTTHHTWTAADTDGLYLVAVDSGTLNVRGVTATFVQSQSPGWAVAFPSQQGPVAVMSSACRP